MPVSTLAAMPSGTLLMAPGRPATASGLGVGPAGSLVELRHQRGYGAVLGRLWRPPSVGSRAVK